jgi:hypothetical protein
VERPQDFRPHIPSRFDDLIEPLVYVLFNVRAEFLKVLLGSVVVFTHAVVLVLLGAVADEAVNDCDERVQASIRVPLRVREFSKFSGEDHLSGQQQLVDRLSGAP